MECRPLMKKIMIEPKEKAVRKNRTAFIYLYSNNNFVCCQALNLILKQQGKPFVVLQRYPLVSFVSFLFSVFPTIYVYG